MKGQANPVEAAFAAVVFGGAALAAAALGLMGAHLASSQLFPAQEFAAFEETAPDLRDAAGPVRRSQAVPPPGAVAGR